MARRAILDRSAASAKEFNETQTNRNVCRKETKKDLVFLWP